MDNKRASSVLPKLWIYVGRHVSGRGAFCQRGSRYVSYCGAGRKANVGISNDKAGGKPAHRKTKVS